MEIIRELWEFLLSKKKLWLFPILIFLLIMGALIVFSSGSALGPFLYTLF